MWDIDMNEVVEPGLFDVLAGANSQDLKAATLEIA
jgi:beta-glucosidase